MALVGEPSWLVVIPTHDHPSTIAHAVGSVLDQEVTDFQLVIIGDGVGDDTREVVADLCRSDDRVSFIDRPKAPSRNEVARHAVVSASGSPMITYLGDDDLFLPHHLGLMQDLLVDHDFAHPFPVFVQPSGELNLVATDLADPRWVDWHLRPGHNAVSLSGAAHTGDLYWRLPFGWRPTPEGRWSDHYMWEQIFTTTGVRLATSPWATTVKLSSDLRTEVAAFERGVEIRYWLERIRTDGFRGGWDAEISNGVHRAAVDQTLVASEVSEELVAVRQRHAEEAADLSRELSAEQHRRGQIDHEVEILRDEIVQLHDEVVRLGDEAVGLHGRHAALAADHEQLTQELGRVAGTRTWRLRDRLVGSPLIRSIVAHRSGAT